VCGKPVSLKLFRKAFYGASLFLVCAVSASAQPAARVPASLPGADCSIADTAIEIASRIRKLSIERSVPCRLQSKAEVEKYLRETIKKKVPLERTTSEGKVYELLGLVPLGFDYLNNIIKLYTEQLGGYYDPELRSYAMASWLPAVMQMPIAVHELTHALQDQHFHLDALMDEQTAPSDALMARSALVEGDATAVMIDYTRGLSGQPSIAEEKSVSGFLMQNITGAMISSNLALSPPALQAILIFPYVSGLNFAHQLLRKGGYAEVDTAFRKLPRSTEEILHPEQYFLGKKGFQDLPLPLPPKGSAFSRSKAVFDDRLGEFVISTLISSYSGPLTASTAAAGWGGDRIAFYRGNSTEQYLLLWNTHWDSEKDAVEFFEALRGAYEKRFSMKAELGETFFEFPETPAGKVRAERTGDLILLSVQHP
jgi:hypothetical protein